MHGEVDGWDCKMWIRTHFYDVRLDIGARLFSAFMIGCTYKFERTLALSFIYSRSIFISISISIFIFISISLSILYLYFILYKYLSGALNFSRLIDLIFLAEILRSGIYLSFFTFSLSFLSLLNFR